MMSLLDNMKLVRLLHEKIDEHQYILDWMFVSIIDTFCFFVWLTKLIFIQFFN